MQTTQQPSMLRNLNINHLAPYIEWAIVVFLPLSGLLHPAPKMYYNSLLVLFVIITGSVLATGQVLYKYSKNTVSGCRAKGVKHPQLAERYLKPHAPYLLDAVWQLGRWAFTGQACPPDTPGTLQEMGLTWWMVVLEMYAGIIVIDAYSYWKHRLLHTRFFFPFHKTHHSFRNPTPFGGFAVGPLEAFLTFWPVVIICYPPAKHFVPLYITAIGAFVVLNLYLHCGVAFSWIEKIILPIGLNSSGWHNYHHSDVVSNFGELSYIWDKICKTSRQDVARRKLTQAPDTLHAQAEIVTEQF